MESDLEVLNVLSQKIDTVWVLVAAALVFLMQAGFKSLEVGMVRKKHIETVAIKNVIDWVVASLIFFIFGFGLMFGESISGFIGTNLFFEFNFDGIANGSPLGTAFFMFQLAFAGTALTIVSGAMSERTGFIPYMVTSVFVALIIYPVFGHWSWGNLFFESNDAWLADIGFVDFAGSSVVHSVGAWVSLAGLLNIGSRIGRFNSDGSARDFKPYNISYAVLGMFLLWFGWWGFNGGSTLVLDASVGKIILNTNIAGAAAALTAYFHCKIFQDKRSIYEKIIGGALGGLVAITASAHIQNPLTSMVIGVLAGFVHNVGFEYLLKKKIDDAVGAIPVHGFCGALGTLLVVISPQYIMPETGFSFVVLIQQIGIQITGVVTCFMWAFPVSYAMFYILKRTVGLRVSPEEERMGITLFPNADQQEEELNKEELERILEQIN